MLDWNAAVIAGPTIVGGYHSHGAVVAREFGIPAVANIPGVLLKLRDGEEITVNGDAGIIVRFTE